MPGAVCFDFGVIGWHDIQIENKSDCVQKGGLLCSGILGLQLFTLLYYIDFCYIRSKPFKKQLLVYLSICIVLITILDLESFMSYINDGDNKYDDENVEFSDDFSLVDSFTGIKTSWF